MYALIQEGQFVSYGALPDKVYANDRWYDLRNNDTALIAEAGYVLVVEVPRPEDTETVVYDNWDVKLVEGVPTMVWRSRTLSQEEIEAEIEQNVRLDDLDEPNRWLNGKPDPNKEAT